MEPSKSFAAEFLAYARERLLSPKILVLAAAVAACAAIASRTQRPEISAPLAFLLVWQFRLWDDLEDLGFDRVHHPERTTVLSVVPRAFWATAMASLFLAGLAIALASGGAQALAFAGLVAVLGGGYRLTRRFPQNRLARAHLVLAKYPAFAFLAAWEPAFQRAVPAAALLYLVLCLLEIVDDPALRGMREARALATAEAIAIAGIIAYGALQ